MSMTMDRTATSPMPLDGGDPAKHAHPARPADGVPQGGAGFGPVMILLMALGAAIAIGIWVSRGTNANTTGMTQNAARTEASTMQQTGSAIASAFSAAMVRDSFTPSQITFDTSARTTSSIGIYNPTDGYAVQPAMQTSALVAPVVGSNPVSWQRMQANIADIGTGSGHYVAVLPNVRTPVCQAINAGRWNYGTSASVPVASSVTAANATAGLGTSNGVGAVTLALTTTSPANFTDGKDEACLSSSDGTNFYYKVIAVQ